MNVKVIKTFEGRHKMKTKEELNVIKEEVETLNKKLADLTEEELKQVTGGGIEPVIEAAVLYRTGHVSVS